MLQLCQPFNTSVDFYSLVLLSAIQGYFSIRNYYLMASAAYDLQSIVHVESYTGNE